MGCVLICNLLTNINNVDTIGSSSETNLILHANAMSLETLSKKLREWELLSHFGPNVEYNKYNF